MDSVGLIVFVFFCSRMVLFRVQRWLIYGKKKVICNDLVWLFFFFPVSVSLAFGNNEFWVWFFPTHLQANAMP
jgi:hypothetical protein